MGLPSELQCIVRDRVARLRLARPERRNALSRAMVAALTSALDHVAGEPEVRAVVIEAEGPVFCSGHDLTELVGREAAEYEELFGACSRMMHRMRHLPQPVIARVHGPAVAAGCQLVAACDLAVAADSATFSTPGVKIGLFCTTPMVPILRSVAPKAAFEMLLTGESIDAARAGAIGLVNRVVPADRLDATIESLLRPILDASPSVVRLGKAAFHDQLGVDEVTGYHRAIEIMTDNALQPDAQEGIAAFLQKRRPVWTGS
ncbi:MAG: enoyl-CoA hydratase [Isosphaeraceae bacterium]